MTGNWRNKHPLPTTIRFFKIILRTSLQHGKLKLPKDFTRKYGGCMSHPMFLKPPDSTEWEVCWTKHDGDIWFQKGQKEFTLYYSLDHGHMVLFEYKHSSPHFEVHIFDKSTLEIEYPFHGCQEEHDNLEQISDDDSVEILDELPPCQKTKLKSPMSCPQPSKKLRTGTGGDVGRSSLLQNFPKHDPSNQSQGTDFEKSTFAMDEDMVSATECLKVEQLTSTIIEALNRATYFKSKNPFFIVVMKPSDVDAYLNVPSQFAEKYLKKNQQDIILQGLDGRTWPARYALGKVDAGWKKFASDNNLKVGDVCLFELTKSRDLSLKVLIFQLGEESHSPPPQGGKATQRTSLPISPRSFTNEALKEANKFTSENPFFTVIIKPHNRWDHRPLVPNAFSRKYLDKNMQIVRLQFAKKLWPVKLLHYPSGASAKLSSGWTQFVGESKLLKGDVCVFELINKEDAVLDVHIFRGHS